MTSIPALPSLWVSLLWRKGQAPRPDDTGSSTGLSLDPMSQRPSWMLDVPTWMTQSHLVQNQIPCHPASLALHQVASFHLQGLPLVPTSRSLQSLGAQALSPKANLWPGPICLTSGWIPLQCLPCLPFYRLFLKPSLATSSPSRTPRLSSTINLRFLQTTHLILWPLGCRLFPALLSPGMSHPLPLCMPDPSWALGRHTARPLCVHG